MARRLFEIRASRDRDGDLTATTYVVYTDEAGTVLADISTTVGGSSIAGSTVTTTDTAGLGPSAALFYGPPDDTDTLYVRVPADVSLGVQKLNAQADARLDALEAGGGPHPNLAAHNALGLATDAELTTHAGAADPHAGYVLESLFDGKGDLLAASADNTPAKLTVGANDTVLTADSAQAAGVKWATPAASSIGWFVVATGTGNDLTAIQAQITAATAAGGGTVYLRRGAWNVNGTITVPSNVTLLGDGQGATVIAQASTTAALISLTGSPIRTQIRDLYLSGPGSGTGRGIVATIGGLGSVPYLTIRNVTISDFGSHGVDLENPIVSHLDRVVVATCGGWGIYLRGQVAGAAGTSVELTSCFANQNTLGGFRIYNMTYCAMNACAADNHTAGGSIGYLIDHCFGLAMNGCGAEVNTNGLKITEGFGVVVNGFFVYAAQTGGVSVYVTGNANGVELNGLSELDPSGSATNFLKVDAGCDVKLGKVSHVTANSIAGGTTNLHVWNSSLLLTKAGATTVSIDNFGGSMVVNRPVSIEATLTLNANYLQMDEIADPAAPAANQARLFTRDNGSGKTQLATRFPSGAVQVIATEP